MRYVEAPNTMTPDNSDTVFLAGGITGAGPWQAELVNMLLDTDKVLFNPRRSNFDVMNKTMEQEQIKWEFDHLRLADLIAFWFPEEAKCPITLYELGAWSMTDKPLLVGVHPGFYRRRDIEIQTGLVRPDIKIVYSLEDLAKQIREW